jgi:hypothetical protein
MGSLGEEQAKKRSLSGADQRRVRVAVALRVITAELAVTETLMTPAAPPDFLVKVSRLMPEPGAASATGLKLAVTPAGTPDMEKVIGELNPPNAVVVRRTVTLAFLVSTEEDAPATKENPGTLTVRFETFVTPPAFAVTATT